MSDDGADLSAGTPQDAPDGWPSQEWCEWASDREGLRIESKDGTVFVVRVNADW